MEYYKKLYFEKQKHKYELHTINFHIENTDDVVVYNNEPVVGFKLITSDHIYTANSYLDPITGYVFCPSNAKSFNRAIQKRNLIFNGIITAPVVFEYIKDGSFRIRLYDDVKDDMNEVVVEKKVSLSDQKPGTLLRNVEDECYYIYFGLVGQLYVSQRGKASIKKKHLVLKTDYCNFDKEEVIIRSHKFSYVDYTKDKSLIYVKVKEFDPSNVNIKYSWQYEDFILGDYINNGVFDLYGLQYENPSMLLSNTVRRLFKKEDISLTRNKIRIEKEYIGEGSIYLRQTVNYASCDVTDRSFEDVDIRYEMGSHEWPEIDFKRHNYAIEYEGEIYFLAFRALFEIGCGSPIAIHETDLFRKRNYRHSNLTLYKMNNVTILNNESPHYFKKQLKQINWRKPVKLFKVYYVLNNNKFNIIDKPFYDGYESVVHVHEPNLFNLIKNENGITLETPIFDGGEQ